MRIIVKLSTVFLMLTASITSVFAEEAMPEGVPYTRILSAANGESYFEDGFLPFSYMTLPAGEQAGLHSMQIGGESTYMMFPSGVFEDFHPTPNSQMLIVVQGDVEVGTSDGDLRRFSAGMVVMMEDNSGKGHTTRVVGEVPHIALMIRNAAK